MTTVVSGFGTANGNGKNGGTEFLSLLSPQGDVLNGYDNTKPCNEQTIDVPQTFREAMTVREEVFGEQGVPLEAEFDEDDARSWHWVVYASVASTSSPSPPRIHPTTTGSRADEERRASATAQTLAVGTIRLVPPPHGPNKYKQDLPDGRTPHPNSDPPPEAELDTNHPVEPYIKLGRLAILAPYRKLGLARLLINAALTYAAGHPDTIRPPPPPTTMELANQMGKAAEKAVLWNGLVMIHAQVAATNLWTKQGFAEELFDDDGRIEIPKEKRWVEEGLEHMAMWKRLKLDHGRL